MDFRRIAIDAGILALLVLIAYGASLLGGFVFNDHYIDKFLLIKVSEESFWSNLVMRGIIQPLSQPWITASFAFDLQNFAFDASWYHIANMILHYLSCLYFYIFVYRLSRHLWRDDLDAPIHEVALLASALLACHPLVCESVAHISGRLSTITACNFMLVLNFFLWGFWAEKTKILIRGYVLAFIFFVLAIFSDWQGIAIPPVLLSLVILLKPADLTFTEWLKKRWADFLYVIFLMLLVVGALSRGFTADYTNGFALPLKTWTVYVASQFYSLVTYYLRCFILPVGLSVYPPFVTASGLADPVAILGVIFVLVGLYAVYKLREQPIAAFALAMAILNFLPQIFFVQNEIAADHRFYLTCAGLSLLVAVYLKDFIRRWQSEPKVKIFVLIPIVLLMAMTIVRTLDFKSDLKLLKAAVRVNKNDAWAQGMLALALVQASKSLQAMEIAKSAIKIEPTCQPAHLALGKAIMPSRSLSDINKFSDIVMAKNSYKLCREELEIALALAKSQHLGLMQIFDSALNLATALIELDDYPKAREVASVGLSINPNSIVLNLIMGRSLNGLGKYVDALAYLNKSFERDQTNPDIVEPLAEAGLGAGTPSTINAAYNAAKRGIQIKQSHKMHILMARAAFEMGKYSESFRWIETAQKKDHRILQLFICEAIKCTLWDNWIRQIYCEIRL